MVKCIHQAPLEFATALYGMWGNVNAQLAHDTLKSPDVTVTNQRDKEMQLPKILQLDVDVRETMSGRK